MTNSKHYIVAVGLICIFGLGNLPGILQGSTALSQDREQAPGRPYSSSPDTRPRNPAPQGASPVSFTDVTKRSGVNFSYNASPTTKKYLLETMGGGVALFDYDNDGLLDIYFTNGAKLQDPMPKGALPDKTEPRYWNRLYHQKSDHTFEDVTEKAGVRGRGYAMGVAAADFNNDGWVDLYVTAYGGNTLCRNNGDGTFTDVTSTMGVGSDGWSTSAGWLDYDHDGRLDLFVAKYMEWDFEKGALYCGERREGYRAYCHPDNFRGVSNLLFHQKPDGKFEDVNRSSGIGGSPGKGLGVAFADFDGDGNMDIFVANDSVKQSLFHNKGDGAFEEIALLSGVGYDESGKTFAGMGVDAADYDNDGLPDIIITTLSNENYALFRNNGDLTFTYTTNTSGLGQITSLNTGWGTRFFDVDLDGRLDIFVAQSHVLDTIEKTSSILSYRQPPLLVINNGKHFVNVSASAGPPFAKELAARGAALGDIDNDGDIDVVIAVNSGPPVILLNGGTPNNWIGISLVGTVSNRSALGARVTIIDGDGRRQMMELENGSSYLSSSDPRLVFGIGKSKSVRFIEIRWPSGRTEQVSKPKINHYLTITESKNSK